MPADRAVVMALWPLARMLVAGCLGSVISTRMAVAAASRLLWPAEWLVLVLMQVLPGIHTDV